MNWVFIVGCPRSGTSYLTGQLAAAGIPMWLEQPGTIHNEDPLMISACDDLGRGDLRGMELWKHRALARGLDICGAKDARLIRYPAPMQHIFSDKDTKYIICIRDVEAACRSMVRLTGWDYERCAAGWLYDVVFLPQWRRPNVHWFCYNGDIAQEERMLSAFVGRPVELVKNWRPRNA